MAYLLICKDKKNSLKKRLTIRNEHLDYIRKFKKKLILAGPILDKNEKASGSIIILDIDNVDDVKNFIQNDPYSKIKLFDKITIHKFKKVF
jgi:uncharacterized protein YciI